MVVILVDDCLTWRLRDILKESEQNGTLRKSYGRSHPFNCPGCCSIAPASIAFLTIIVQEGAVHTEAHRCERMKWLRNSCQRTALTR